MFSKKMNSGSTGQGLRKKSDLHFKGDQHFCLTCKLLEIVLALLKNPKVFHILALFAMNQINYFLSVCFVALCPKSIAMVMAERSVHLITLFPGQA